MSRPLVLLSLSWPVRLGISLAVAAVTLAAVHGLHVSTGVVSFQLPLAAVLLAAAVFGWRTGLVVLVATAAGVLVLELAPRGRLLVRDAGEGVRWGLFVVNSLLLTALAARLHAAYVEAETSRRRYRQLIDWLDHSIVWEADAETGRYHLVGQRAEHLLGFPVGCWYDHPGYLHARTVEEDRPVLRRMQERALAEDRSLTCQHRLTHEDGAVRWYQTGVHVDREEGRPRLFGLTVSIHELKTAQEEAQRAVAGRDEVLAVVSHDLRNPLGGMLMNAQLVRRIVGDRDPVVQRATEAILRGGKVMSRLIDDLLLFAKAEAGHLRLERRPEPLAPIVGDVVQGARALAEDRDQLLSCDVSPPDLRVVCDPSHLHRVVANLVHNALKFTPDGGAVRVEVHREGEDAHLRVVDTGPGIPAEDLERVFERYWQGATRREAGAGLGLAIARRIVQEHGGRIWAESTFGEGSTFHVLLPTAVGGGGTPAAR